MRQLRAALLGLLILLGLTVPWPVSQAAQGSLCMPTTGTVSGLTFAQDVNAALAALVSANSGATAPANGCLGAIVAGQFWLDSSASPSVLKVYDGTAWETLGTVDAATGRWTPPVGGGADSIASAGTTDLWTKPQAYITVSGTTTITALATNGVGVTGSMKVVNFSGILQLTYNATSLILPGSSNITTQAGDKAVVVNLGGGNAVVVAYTRRDGSSITPTSTFSTQVAFTGAITPTALTGTVNNWAPTGLATAAVIRADASATTSLTGITAQPTGALLMLQSISAASTITLVDESASSTAANRFALSADWPIGPGDSVLLRYDGTLTRWVVVSAVGRMATQSEATTGTDNYALMTPLRVDQAIDNTVSAGYIFSQRQNFTVDGSWTPGAGASVVHVVLCGAGGGGGGADDPAEPSGSAAGGGGAGETIDFWAPVSDFSTPVTVNLGNGGSGGSGTGGASGTAGQDTTFGSYATANGGGGGGGANYSAYHASNGGTGGTGGTGPSGFLSFGGADGSSGTMGDGGAGSSLVNGTGGTGGSSQFGGGGRGRTTFEDNAVAGDDANNYCSGGGGAVAFTTSGQAGGDGSDGMLYVEEYRSVK